MTGDDTATKSVVTIGESMALFTGMTTGPLRHVSTMSVSVAGSESNVAIGLRRLGIPASWVGRVGDDEFGELVLRTLNAESVSTEHAVVDRDAPTGLVFRERRTADLSRVHYYRRGSAGSRLEPGDIPDEVVAGARLLHITGITPALSDSARRAVRHAVRVASAAGVPISMDVNYRATLWPEDSARSEFMHLIPEVDVLFAGRFEAAVALGQTPAAPLDAAKALQALGPTVVVVKNGAEGCVLVDPDTEAEQSAPDVRVVDTVGAGDALVSGFLSAWLDGAPSKECLLRGSIASAFSVGVEGDWEGLPSSTEISAAPHDDDIVR
jgi:2-dehydro-3-deoxygluconokinase